MNRGAKVIPQVTQAAPVTLSLVLGAAVIWVIVSILMGLLAAVFRGTAVDTVLMILGLIGISMPVFWLGEVVNLISQSRFHHSFLFSWVPQLGYTPLTQSPLGWFKSLLLPWLTLAVLYIGIYARVLRSALIEAQEQDYVRTARAKGLTERRVLLRHALRTSMITFVSLFGLDFGALVGGGALLTEVVFGLHGRRQADVRLATEFRPARDHGDRHVRSLLRGGRRTLSSTSSTPGSTPGCALPDGAGTPLLEVRDLRVSFRTEAGLVQAVDRLSLSRERRRGARDRRRVRFRKDRLDAGSDAADP